MQLRNLLTPAIAIALGTVIIVTSAPSSAAEIIIGVTPPALQAEIVPPVPGPGWAWRPGYWRWNGVRYVWVGGRYLRGPRAGAVWVAGHWAERPRGWVWVPGHWR